MSVIRNNQSEQVFSWTLVFVWMAGIFYFSSQSAVVSGQSSSNVAYAVYRVIAYVLLIDMELSAETAFLGGLNNFLRALAHFSFYFILALLVVNAVIQKGMTGVKAIRAAFLFCVVTAVADELFQTFIPGRGGQLSDVLLDSAGALLGLGLYYAVSSLRRERLKGRRKAFAALQPCGNGWSDCVTKKDTSLG